jgi:hypothetical protein
MYPPDGLSPLLPLPEIKKYSRFGIASFILSLLAIIIICADMSIVLILLKNTTFIENYKAVDSLITCSTAGLAITGLGLGIVSVTQKDKNKVFGILGLVFNGLFLLGFCGLLTYNILTMMGT